MSQLQRWMTRTRVWTGDGYNLLRALVVRETKKDDVRTVLVNQARDHSNTMAISLLKVNQQIGLLQYHGFIGYCKQSPMANVLQGFLYGIRDNKRSIQADNHNDSDKAQHDTTQALSSKDNTTLTTARVAFMITTTQKEDLKQRLGYDIDDIKKLSPLKASLILQHGITSAQLKEETGMKLLQSLIQEYNEQITQQNLQSMATQQQEQPQMTTTTTRAVAAENNDTTTSSKMENLEIDEKDEKNSTGTLLLTGNLPLEKEKNAMIASDTVLEAVESGSIGNAAKEEIDQELVLQHEEEKETWYEVVEINPHDDKNTRHVVALYSTKKEAEFFVEIKQEFALNRRRQEQKQQQDQGDNDKDIVGSIRYEVQPKKTHQS